MKKVNTTILDLSLAQIREVIQGMGEPDYRVDQIISWLYRELATSFAQMTDLPQSLRQKLAAKMMVSVMTPIDDKTSRDGQTRKVLFQLSDGRTIESALMLYPRNGKSPERRTVCVSTQVGCPIGCPFCATGQQSFERNLSPGEMMEQVLYFERWLRLQPETKRVTAAKRYVTNVVFMGMGEPLANYESLMQCVRMLHSSHGLGLGARQITISTVGLVLQIQRLATDKPYVELAVSLHAANDELRNRLVPINKKYPLLDLMDACREYFRKTGRRPTFEYALFRGINDGKEYARELARLLRGQNCLVNLIPANATGSSEFVTPTEAVVLRFERELRRNGISCTVRLSRGTDIAAGCGQLRSRRRAHQLEESNPRTEQS